MTNNTKYNLPNGWYLPSAIAVYVGEVAADPDKYKYINAHKLLELFDMYVAAQEQKGKTK